MANFVPCDKIEVLSRKYPISVVIPTFNEADNLSALLPMLSWADEILVVDSFSQDDGPSMARSFGAKVIQRVYENSASQKNWALPQTKHPWVFLIDADERPQTTLTSEIQALIDGRQLDNGPKAYWIRRDNHFMGKRIRYSGWQGDKVIRLFDRRVCRYEDKHVHAEIICSDGLVSMLKGRLDHFTFKNAAHFLEKMNQYAIWSANDHDGKTSRIGYFHLFFKPLFRFKKHFFLQRGFLDGRVGLIVCVLLAWGVFLRYLFLMEKRAIQDK